MPNLKTMIGICAFNEENNIRSLIDNLIKKQDLPTNSSILVICSGCTDGTIDVVKEFQCNDKRLKTILEINRSGKANALNKIFKEAKETADILIIVNADALPEQGSITKLLSKIQSNNAGVVFAQPVPFNIKSGVTYQIVKVVWRLHHLISLFQEPKLSGELCAIRTECIKPIPDQIATDEPYIELIIRQQGYKISYLPEAVVRIRCPTSISDLLKQRRRIWIGHMQLRQSTGFNVSTSSFKNMLQATRKLSPKEAFYASLGSIIEIIAYFQAKSARKETIPYMWEPIKSTKISITT